MNRKSLCRPVPIIFTTCVMVYVFLTFMFFLALPTMQNASTHSTGVAYTVTLSCLFFMLIVSFIRVSIMDPGEIPGWFGDNTSPNNTLKLKCVERKGDGTRRYCNKCQTFKPDRTHHCRVCNRCNLKMDHHCPWINNCVGYHNYKFFILFITYALASCIFVFVVCLTSLPTLDSPLPSSKHVAILSDCIITGALGLALFAFVGFHIYLMLFNYTTIEFVEKRGCSGNQGHTNFYDLGVWENIKRTMGSNPLLWPFPVKWCIVDQNQGTSFDTNDSYKLSSSR